MKTTRNSINSNSTSKSNGGTEWTKFQPGKKVLAKQVTPTKVKMESKYSVYFASKVKFERTPTFYNTIFTKSCGKHGEFIVVTAEQNTGSSSYMVPLVQPTPPILQDINTFDCKMTNHMYLRESHKSNKKIHIGYGQKDLHRVGLVGLSDKSLLLNNNVMFHDKESHVGSNHFFEKLMRDEYKKILLNNNQGRKTKKII